MTKFEIAISAVFIGFVLSQTVDLFKYRWRIYRKKKAVKDEIKELGIEFEERIIRIKKILDDIVLSKFDGMVSPSLIPTIIYDNHYAEVAPFFDMKDRKAISNIYIGVNIYNEEVEAKNCPDINSKKKSLFELFYYCQLSKASVEYFNKYGSKKSLQTDNDKLVEINTLVNEFANKYGSHTSNKPLTQN
ncbi:MAG: hypothetical protein HRU40_17880 [Saprospiraceae bacterium]|nr:hypothetical protein [Saprospiraceae bacterium]